MTFLKFIVSNALSFIVILLISRLDMLLEDWFGTPKFILFASLGLAVMCNWVMKVSDLLTHVALARLRK